jgi:hypothetical protein
MNQLDRGAPHLHVTSPGPIHGRRIALVGDHLVVGRASTSDVRLDDPSVSRRHAVLHRQGEQVSVEDVGSTSGTTVNGIRVRAPRLLEPGDLVAFAGVEMRYAGSAGQEAETTVRPSEQGQAAAERARSGPVPNVRYDIGDQRAGIISNVAGSQYNAYVQQIRDERASFLREIAGTRTKARWLAWTGFALFVLGFGLFLNAILGFLQQGADAVSSGSVAPPVDPFGPEVGGVPSGLVGFAVAALGAVLLTIGIVLHVIAAARRKRVDRELPLPPPWQATF